MVGLLTFREVLATQKAGADWQTLPVEQAMLRIGRCFGQYGDGRAPSSDG